MSKLSRWEIDEIAKEKGLSINNPDDYINLNTNNLIFSCEFGHTFSSSLGTVRDFKYFRCPICSKEQAKYVVKKGSIAINGISLTVADIQGQKITIAIIPHTFENTNLIGLKVGDYVNIEVDILAKYVENFLSTRDNSSGISIDFLQRNGFC